MLKKSIAVAALALMPLSAMADNDAGCGVGTQVWKGQKGLLPKVLAATTNGTFFQTISITFGVLGCSSDGVVTAANRVPMFVGENLDQLSVEMASGSGEALTNLAALYGIEAADRAAFYATARASYSEIFAGDQATTGEVISNLNAVMARNAQLARYVS